MSVRWLTLVMWALVAGSGVAWGLRLFPQPLPLPQQGVVAAPGPAAAADLQRLFGPDPPPPAASVEPAPVSAPPPADASRFRLLGVAAAAPRSAGIALIALDGKPARAYRVGTVIDGNWVLQDVQPRAVAIGARGAPASISLELPPLPPAATGVPAGVASPPPAALPGQPSPMPALPAATRPSQPAAPAAPGFSGATPAPLVIQPPPALPGVQGQPVPSGAARLRALRQPGGGMAVQPQPSPQPMSPLPAQPAAQGAAWVQPAEVLPVQEVPPQDARLRQ